MRKILLLIFSLPVFLINAYAAADKETVRVTDFTASVEESSAYIRFRLEIGKKVTSNSSTVVIQPTLKNGAQEILLPPVVVEGKRARVTPLSRVQTSRSRTDTEPYYTTNGTTILYTAVVPYTPLLAGSELLLNGARLSHYGTEEANLGTIASNLFYHIPKPPLPEPKEPLVVISVDPPAPVVKEVSPKTTADKLAEQFTFVAPVSEFEKARQSPSGGDLFDYNMPLDLGKGVSTRAQADVVRFLNDTREGALAIQFGQARRTIDRELGDNNRTLVDLISTVRAIETSEDSRIVRIIISGFASPEGKLEDNEKLAWDRAIAVRDFLANNSTVDSEVVHVYNGSVDWQGLRKLVAASDMPEKLRVLQIIDSTPIWDAARNTGRHGELMRLSGGEPYKYMLRNFFPLLRQAAYIKVYYENK